MKRLISAFLAAALLAASFAGCSGKSSSPSSASNAASGAASAAVSSGAKSDVTLNVAIALTEEEWAVMKQQIFPKFTEKTGIKVNGLAIEHEDMESKLEALNKAGKSEIDIVAPDNMLLSGMVTKNLIKDLSSYESKVPAEINKNLYQDFKVDGKLYYMPFRPNVKIVFYDENKLKQYGLNPPETWDDLMSMAKTFKEKEGTARYVYQGNQGGSTTVSIFEMIRSAGGDPMVLNDAGSVKAYKFLQDIYPYTSPEVVRTNYSSMNQLLANGTVYYGENWPFCANVVVKQNGKTNIKAYVGTKGPNGYNKVLGGDMLAVAANTKHEAESMELIEYLMSKEAQEIFASQAGWAPARSDAGGTVEEWQKPYVAAVNEAMKYAQPRPIVPYWSDVDKAINDAFREIVVNGNKDIQGVLDKYHQAIETAKAKSSK